MEYGAQQCTMVNRARCTDLHIGEAVEPRVDVVEDTLESPLQGEPEAEEHREDDVGEDGGEVDSLAEALHAPDEGKEDDGPGKDQAAGELKADGAHLRIEGMSGLEHLVNSWRQIQHLLREELLCGGCAVCSAGCVGSCHVCLHIDIHTVVRVPPDFQYENTVGVLWGVSVLTGCRRRSRVGGRWGG